VIHVPEDGHHWCTAVWSYDQYYQYSFKEWISRL